MVYFTDAAVYMEQSILLLQARPSTTRVSTRYTLTPPQRSKASASESEAGAAPRARGALILKTYDPVSGACLKYRTSKQAEIGRLVGAMGRCARVMANVPLQAAEEDEGKAEGAGAGQEPVKTTASAAATASATEHSKSASQQLQQQQQSAGGGGGGGGGKKKKKGKK